MLKKIELLVIAYLERRFFPLLENDGLYIALSNSDNLNEPGCIRFFPFGYDDERSVWPKWKIMHAVVNLWVKPDTGKRHSHKGWSTTLVLAGSGTEDTEHAPRKLSFCSLIFRGHKTPHRFVVDEETVMWTLFIYGRRKHKQIWT